MHYSQITDQTDVNNPEYEEKPISDQMFGVNALINTSQEMEDHLEDLTEELSVTNLRYPGGSVTEKFFNLHRYDGDFDDLVDSENNPNHMEFGDFLDLAAETGATVSLVIPTVHGFTLNAADALLAGDYGDRTVDTSYVTTVARFVGDAIAAASARGVTISAFEIGNEYWGASAAMTSVEYAKLSAELAKAIQAELDTLNLPSEPDILIQSMSSAGDLSPNGVKAVWVNTQTGEVKDEEMTGPNWEEVDVPDQGSAGGQRDDMIGVYAQDAAATAAVDGIVEHIYISSNFDQVDIPANGHWQNDYDSLKDWENQLGKDFDLHVTEWNAKNGSGNAVNRGLDHASMVVEIFYEMSTNGIDSAQIWPLFSSSADSTAVFLDGQDRLTFSGEAFGLLSESLVGLTAFLDYGSSNGAIDIHGFKEVEGVDATIDGGMQVYFVSERSNSAQSNVSIDLSNLTPDPANANNGAYFVAISFLTDDDPNGTGENPNALPVLSYSNGATFTHQDLSALNLGTLDGSSLTRIEITHISDADDVVEGRDGNDSMQGRGGNDTIYGGAGNDTVWASSGDDVIHGGDGNDDLNASTGNDTVYAGPGNDLISASEGFDFVDSGSGQDTIYGFTGNDTINGGADDDQIWGGSGNDLLTGAAGSDTFHFGTGFGQDTITDFSTSDQNERIDLHYVASITSFADLLNNHVTDTGNDLLIDAGNGDTIVLEGVSDIASLSADDFTF